MTGLLAISLGGGIYLEIITLHFFSQNYLIPALTNSDWPPSNFHGQRSKLDLCNGEDNSDNSFIRTDAVCFAVATLSILSFELTSSIFLESLGTSGPQPVSISRVFEFRLPGILEQTLGLSQYFYVQL